MIYSLTSFTIFFFNYIDDVVVTSELPDFDATAPDFGWGEWPNNIYEE